VQPEGVVHRCSTTGAGAAAGRSEVPGEAEEVDADDEEDDEDGEEEHDLHYRRQVAVGVLGVGHACGFGRERQNRCLLGRGGDFGPLAKV
jgi:hypothetical protein